MGPGHSSLLLQGGPALGEGRHHRRGTRQLDHQRALHARERSQWQREEGGNPRRAPPCIPAELCHLEKQGSSGELHRRAGLHSTGPGGQGWARPQHCRDPSPMLGHRRESHLKPQPAEVRPPPSQVCRWLFESWETCRSGEEHINRCPLCNTTQHPSTIKKNLLAN